MAMNTESSVPLLQRPPSHAASPRLSNGANGALPTSPTRVSVITPSISNTALEAISDTDTTSNHEVKLHSTLAKSQNPPLLGRWHKRRHQKESIWSVLARVCRGRLFASSLQLCWKHRSPQEEPKKAITERSWLRFLVRFLVHLPPLCGSITLVVLNIHGYFIGSSYSGLNINPAIDSYALQLTAKLMELFMVASVATIVLDVIRYEMLHGKEGLPLGLVGSASAFKDVSFFWSPSLWYGTAGISSKWQRCQLVVLLILAGMVAAFAGPSSAVLLIPSIREFPGGGTDFWFVGTENSLWPQELDSYAVGGTSCLNATDEMLYLMSEDYPGCIWSTTSAIAEVAKGWQLISGASTMSVVDGYYERTISFRASDRTGPYADTWAVSSGYAASAYSTALSSMWYNAIYNAPIAIGSVSIPQRLKFRTLDLTVATIPTQLPAVRVSCNYTNKLVPGSSPVLHFPLFDYYSANPGGNLKMVVDLVNSSSILTQWIPVPQNPPPPTDPQDNYPSTFLAIQVSQNATSSIAYSCGIDARWVNGDARLFEVAQASPVQLGIVTSATNSTDAFEFPRYIPIDDGTWRQVSIDLDWLYTLTPFLNNSESPSPSQSRESLGWTSLSEILATAGLDNSTGLVQSDMEWSDATPSIECIIAILVAEGMARIGQTENGNSDIYFQTEEGGVAMNGAITGVLNSTMNAVWNSILLNDNKAIVPPLNVSADNIYRSKWTVTVTGFAYKGDGVSSWLAMSVLLLYDTLVAFHLLWWLIRTRESSDAWDTFEEIIALSYNSRPNHHRAMRNTSAGIRTKIPFQTLVRVRVLDDAMRVSGEEEVQLVLGPVAGGESYKEVKADTLYGVVEE